MKLHRTTEHVPGGVHLETGGVQLSADASEDVNSKVHFYAFGLLLVVYSWWTPTLKASLTQLLCWQHLNFYLFSGVTESGRSLSFEML